MEQITNCQKDGYADAIYLLVEPELREEDFIRKMASNLGLMKGLTRNHVTVFRFILKVFKKTGRCPMVHQVCRETGLRLTEFRKLFPGSYQRCESLLAEYHNKQKEKTDG